MTKHTFIFSGLLAVMLGTACSSRPKATMIHHLRADFRFGGAFYSLCANEKGEAVAIKGRGTDYGSDFKVLAADTSAPFQLTTAALLFHQLDSIRRRSMVKYRNMDAPRVEIYYDDKKIYDQQSWDGGFWDIFRPLIAQFPERYNPFILEGNLMMGN